MLSGKTLCNSLIVATSLAGIVIAVVLPERIEAYSEAVSNALPLIIGWMGAIFGGNAVRAYTDRGQALKGDTDATE